jgi:hypothetical protein
MSSKLQIVLQYLYSRQGPFYISGKYSGGAFVNEFSKWPVSLD